MARSSLCGSMNNPLGLYYMGWLRRQPHQYGLFLIFDPHNQKKRKKKTRYDSPIL